MVPAGAELEPGARNAVEVCLGIQPDERVALIADEASGEVAASLAAALDDVGAPLGRRPHRAGARTRPLGGAPSAVLAALERADAGILCIQPQAGRAGRAHGNRVARRTPRGMRYAHMVGVTSQIMQQGMRADYKLVDELSQRLCERMRHARHLRVTRRAARR